MTLIVKPLCVLVGAYCLFFQSPVLAATVPLCQTTNSDSDGDGWGWEHHQSCRVSSFCIDTDGDGWGWDGYRSCLVQSTETQSTRELNIDNVAQCVDTDGDGWGWDGAQTCVLDNARVLEDQPNGVELPDISPADNCAKLHSGGSPMVDLVTDVVLTAGQSNAAGNKTLFDPNHPLDQVNERILAWTSRQQWEMANPASQVWNAGRFPKGPGVAGFNHPAYQIARSIVQQDNCRVVAIVASSASGEPISYWLNNIDDHFSLTSKKVSDALAKLPNKSRVDMIWWMQGESDNHPNYLDYNAQINQLIQLYRSQSWFDSTRYFLANETGWFVNANKAIRLLASDADINTNFSANPVSLYPGRVLHIESEGVTVHFNETALRIIGDLVRDEYLFDYRVRHAE